MRDFFLKWLVNVLALLVVVHALSGINVDKWQTTVIAGLVIGLLNAFLRPLILFFTLPFNILSLGFFTLVINGFIFYLASKFVEGFMIISFWDAFWGALLFSIISFFLNLMIGPKTTVRVRTRSSGYEDRPRYKDVIDVQGRPKD